MHQISIERAVGENILKSLREDWKQLFAATECSPFLSWEWLSTWYKWFGGDRDLFVLKAYRENQLIGLMPLCLQEKRVLGLKLIRLSFMGEAQGGADYLDLIAKPEEKAEILSAILDFLKKENNFDLICLENLASDCETAKFLLDFEQLETKPRLRRTAQTSAICPQIELTGDWETILKQSKRASNFKRRLKQLEKMPGFEFRSVTSPSEAEEAFERFYRLHEKRWRKSGGSELSGHPRLVSFQRDLVLKLAQAALVRFDELWVEGECRASVYGLDDRRAFYYYNSGYDLEWSSRSVGLVLIGLSIKSAVERGNSLYDFLRGDETYKFDWSNKQTELVTVTLSQNTATAKMHENLTGVLHKLKNFSKSALPADAFESVKNWRRKWKRNRQLSDLEAEKIGQAV
ncbi:MAG: GNAT family N-acetyltransferase [Acidobacteriota bacterium]|nr:GNAT family N-acetyltransferase [Acidobacteriota bacterium]